MLLLLAFSIYLASYIRLFFSRFFWSMSMVLATFVVFKCIFALFPISKANCCVREDEWWDIMWLFEQGTYSTKCSPFSSVVPQPVVVLKPFLLEISTFLFTHVFYVRWKMQATVRGFNPRIISFITWPFSRGRGFTLNYTISSVVFCGTRRIAWK